MINKKQAQALIEAIIDLRESATNEQAQSAAILYPIWETNKKYYEGNRIIHKGNLYVVSQDHESNIDNSPELNTEIYTKIV